MRSNQRQKGKGHSNIMSMRKIIKSPTIRMLIRKQVNTFFEHDEVVVEEAAEIDFSNIP